MQADEPYLIFTRKLEGLGLRYMISGSVAAIYYGEPRMTNDVDLVLFLRKEDVFRVVNAFAPGEFYCPPVEVIEGERLRDLRGHFNLIHHETGFKADVYLSGRDEFHAWGIGRIQTAEIDEDRLAFAPPEYVIIRKLQFYQEGSSQKHLRDIRRMLVGMGEDWPMETLLELVKRYRLEPEWALVISEEA